MPTRTDRTGVRGLVELARAAPALELVAATLLAIALALSPGPALAAGALSDGSVTPTSGTSATAFTFTVSYLSTDSPTRPAQTVWADVGGMTVPLVKVSGAAHDGTWQGTSTLPAGTWQVTFNATTSADPQPEPLAGPIVTVTQAPTPTPPPPTPRPPAPPTPRPTARPAPGPTVAPNPPPATDAPLATAPTAADAGDDPTATPRASSSARSSAAASASASARPMRTPSESAEAPSVDADPSRTSDPTDLAADEPDTRPPSMLASLLIVGGTLSLAGAAVLARQWWVVRAGRP